MRNFKKTLLLLLVCSMLLFTSCAGFVTSNKFEAADFEIKGINKISVKCSANIHVIKTESDKIILEMEKWVSGIENHSAFLEGIKINVKKFDETLFLELVYPSSFFISLKSYGVKLTLKIPSVYSGKLFVDNFSNSTKIEDFNGEVEVKNFDGNVDIIKVNNNVCVESNSGEVRLDSVIGNIKVDNKGEKTHIINSTGIFNINNSYGMIRMSNCEFLNGTHSLKAENEPVDLNIRIPETGYIDITASDIKVCMNKNSKLTMNASVFLGDININNLNYEKITNGIYKFNGGSDSLKLLLNCNVGDINIYGVE